jgi:hypothetical protein
MRMISQCAAAAILLASTTAGFAQTPPPDAVPSPAPSITAPGPDVGVGTRALRGPDDDLPVQGNVSPSQQRPLEVIPGTAGPGPIPPAGETTNPAISSPSPN